jgi:hypothetical protein
MNFIMPSAAEIFLAHSTTKLTQMTGHIETCLQKLDDKQTWHRPNPMQNSIGNLVLHLSGNVRQWIGSSIGGQPDIRNRDHEFPADQTPDLLPILKTTVIQAIEILENLPSARLTDRVSTQDGDRLILEMIYQVVGHFQQHTGQIIFATKLLTGEDLKFYAPPKKSS